LRAAMIAAPRFWTQGMNSLVYQASSLITSLAAWPASHHRHSPVSTPLFCDSLLRDRHVHATFTHRTLTQSTLKETHSEYHTHMHATTVKKFLK
jgi:hypothetical protein